MSTGSIAPAVDSLSRTEAFIDRLRKLDRGAKAILKRNAGHTLAEERNATGIFYRLLPAGVPEREEEVYFLIATLAGHDDRAFIGDLGQTMRAVKDRTRRDSLDRRFAILLDSEMDLIDGFKPGGGELAYRLRQCVKLAASHEVGVDWPRLLEDLLRWNRPDKRVRKEWAKSYYCTRVEKDTAPENEGGNE